MVAGDNNLFPGRVARTRLGQVNWARQQLGLAHPPPSPRPNRLNRLACLARARVFVSLIGGAAGARRPLEAPNQSAPECIEVSYCDNRPGERLRPRPGRAHLRKRSRPRLNRCAGARRPLGAGGSRLRPAPIRRAGHRLISGARVRRGAQIIRKSDGVAPGRRRQIVLKLIDRGARARAPNLPQAPGPGRRCRCLNWGPRAGARNTRAPLGPAPAPCIRPSGCLVLAIHFWCHSCAGPIYLGRAQFNWVASKSSPFAWLASGASGRSRHSRALCKFNSSS